MGITGIFSSFASASASIFISLLPGNVHHIQGDNQPRDNSMSSRQDIDSAPELAAFQYCHDGCRVFLDQISLAICSSAELAVKL